MVYWWRGRDSLHGVSRLLPGCADHLGGVRCVLSLDAVGLATEAKGVGASTLSAALAVVPEEVTIQQIHAGVIESAEKGDFTIINLFDCLPWFRTGADWFAWRVFLK